MHWQTTHHLDHAIDVQFGDTVLFRYVYRSAAPTRESPKPYFHPLRTMRGDLLTNFRPTDHPWHHGLAMTSAELSGQNFWGGGTFVRDEGYKNIDNYGRQDHQAWDTIEQDAQGVRLAHRLKWITFEGQHWLDEARRIHAIAPAPDEGWWALSFHTKLHNVSGQTLAFGSPTTKGRPGAGYGSLFWRGPRDWTGGSVSIPDGPVDADEMRGQSAPWLAFTGQHDGTLNTSTLIFADCPDNPRYPNKWFVRNKPFATTSCSFMFDQVLELPADKTLELSYTVIAAEGAPETDAVERMIRCATA